MADCQQAQPLMNILVTGASSQIGYFLVPRLLYEGHRVTGISRKSRPAWIAEHQSLIWTAEQQLRSENMAGIEAIVSAGPIALTSELIQRCPGLKALAVISTSSIHFKRDSSNAEERKMLEDIVDQEQQLRRQAEQRNLPCAVLRPTMVYGAGLDKNIRQLAQLAVRFNRIPVLTGANGLRQPVHADDLALACVRLISAPLTGCWYAGGATRLSYLQLSEAVCAALGRGSLLKLPLPVLKGLLKIVKLTGRYAGINSNMFARQRLDMCVDNKPAAQDWGWQPRSFDLQAEALQLPSAPFNPAGA